MLVVKNTITLLCGTLLVLLVTPLFPQIENPPPYEIIGIKLSISDSKSNIFIQTTREPNVNHFRVNKPPRLVADFTNARISLSQKNFLKLPDGIIVFVRTSQYQEKPIPIARMVFDLAERTIDYNVVTKPYGISIDINTPGYPLFSDWVVGTVEKDYKPPEKTTPSESTVAVPQKDTAAVSIPVPPPIPLPDDTLKQAEAPKDDTIAQTPKVPEEIEIATPLYKRPELYYSFIDTVGDSLVPRRDPFVIVKPTQQMTLGKPIYPDIERLELVGIVKTSVNERIILLEDNQGFGFILSAGDSVLNGRCTDITDEKATFIIEEFGWSRSITLELPEEQP
ncbi:AMIN domain-containing protein [bacterium]|nr:AMIN domain-containing protein [bacterium]